MSIQGGFFMQTILNFSITSNEIISRRFLELGFSDFESASKYVQLLPYKRNVEKGDKLCVFEDFGGTCSTKHALLKSLALENNFIELKLILGIFIMNETNTSKISSVLKMYNLKEMPEAHNYLKYRNDVLDLTRKNSSPENFIHDLVEEIEIQPHQIIDFKIEYHRNFLKNYLKANPHIPYVVDDFWKIREECIFALQQ